MWKKTILFMLFATSQFGCSTKDIGKYDVEPLISSTMILADTTEQAINIDLCGKTNFKWSSMIIVPPYNELSVLRKEDLENMRALRKLMPGLTADEGYCALLFVENKTVVRYSLAPRNNFDFNQIVGPDRMMVNITKDVVCKVLKVQRRDGRYWLFLKED